MSSLTEYLTFEAICDRFFPKQADLFHVRMFFLLKTCQGFQCCSTARMGNGTTIDGMLGQEPGPSMRECGHIELPSQTLGMEFFEKFAARGSVSQCKDLN